MVEEWTEGDESFHVIRLGFKSIVTQIIQVLAELPPGSEIWEVITYNNGETAELVIRSTVPAEIAVA